jgi:hypothetical protein
MDQRNIHILDSLYILRHVMKASSVKMALSCVHVKNVHLQQARLTSADKAPGGDLL